MSRLCRDSWAVPACFVLIAGALLAAAAEPAAAAAAGKAPTAVTFTDIALDAGFQDRLSHGRAMVAADFNQDGWVDFFFGNPGLEPYASDESFILWNNGPGPSGDFTFSKGQVLCRAEICFTASASDFDNDGDPDLFIGVGGQEGVGLDKLFRNDGGVFADVSDTAQVYGPRMEDGTWVPVATSSGTWADYDNDGDLDLFVSSRENVMSLILPDNLGWRNSLFRNNGDGTFTDVSIESRVGEGVSTMTAAWGDFDNDGWMDLYVPTHEPGYRLYRNNQDGTFTKVVPGFDVGDRAVWAASVADFDKNGQLDVFAFGRGLDGFTGSHALLMNHGDWSFTNEAVAAGLVPPDQPVPTVMGTALGDMDNDGYPEVYMGNGGPLWTERDKLFQNVTVPGGPVAFTDVSHLIDYAALPDPNCVPPPDAPQPGTFPSLVDHFNMLAGRAGDCGMISTLELPLAPGDACNPEYPYRGHGSLFVDFDHDGDLDLAAIKGGTAIIAPDVNSTEPNRLFRNDGGNANHWLFIDLEGSVSNRDGYGARIEVVSSRAGGSPTTIVQQEQGNTGFSASGPEERHFGLGQDDRVERISVAWPSGVVTVLEDLPVDQRLAIREEVLGADTFNDGAAPGWVPLAGTWDVRDGVYGQQTTGPGAAVKQGRPLADYTVVGKLTYQGGQGHRLGLAGRVSPDGKNFYAVILTDTGAQLYRSFDGQMQALGQPISIAAMTRGRSYIVSLSMRGNVIQAFVDRQGNPPVLDTRVPGGTIALLTFDTLASFDNVAVY